MSETTDLVVIEKSNAMAVFTTKEQLDPIIEAIEKEARSLVPDVTTKKGRDAIASMAHKVARSKTYIDNAGKELVAELKALPKQIDESRRVVRERLDALKDEVRRPLNEWEQAEDERKQALRQRLADLRALADVIDDAGNYLPSSDIQARLSEAKAVTLDDTWQEIATEAGVAKDATVQKLESAVIVAKQREDQAAELERLRKEAEEKARRDHEEKLKQEAAEAARREAEQKAQVEHEAAERREAELKAKAEQAERDRIAAQERAEREAREAQERTARLAQEAREQAEREKQAAIAEEQRKAKAAEDARLAEEKRIADETAKRAANEAHRKAVGTAVVNALIANAGLSREAAIATLVALKDGLIPHTTINY
ncbi:MULTISPECIES: hypothetical protein [Pantoea]|uniref:TolA protein n=2 Tax=Pantoea TaxID=53335 RepID=A0A0U3T3W1_9GAMM|nr:MULTISPECIES: hypothetical protein [Pantoea]ALV92452.1 hypothetical protein LK04_09960 [Pantoea vagans]KHJ67994.1 hypothetical protein QU24_11290 [Pantoea rodasii]